MPGLSLPLFSSQYGFDPFQRADQADPPLRPGVGSLPHRSWGPRPGGCRRSRWRMRSSGLSARIAGTSLDESLCAASELGQEPSPAGHLDAGSHPGPPCGCVGSKAPVNARTRSFAVLQQLRAGVGQTGAPSGGSPKPQPPRKILIPVNCHPWSGRASTCGSHRVDVVRNRRARFVRGLRGGRTKSIAVLKPHTLPNIRTLAGSFANPRPRAALPIHAEGVAPGPQTRRNFAGAWRPHLTPVPSTACSGPMDKVVLASRAARCRVTRSGQTQSREQACSGRPDRGPLSRIGRFWSDCRPPPHPVGNSCPNPPSPVESKLAPRHLTRRTPVRRQPPRPAVVQS